MASFEIYEDVSGQRRWRLRSRDRIVADSGDPRWDPDDVREALERVRDGTPDGPLVEDGSPHSEVYRDQGGDWHWRLVGPEGRVLADSADGYATMAAARDAIEALRAVTDVAPGPL